ncbi:MAG: precorrin-2 C(20)-methyltransferase [Megasphaera sp.]|jgi:precorrin-2/cobalt-factor-2 C20-methyltransferase|nr:precorrin-2 C(20)-methyltransferase [Megasphaera sp.]MCH4187771.1 precorrin-2 C(20)-methyltransferase [Megasphaera sp.]MCH4217824.1 precorrin-2 C(20)-methyltransferase [Megasphaera sp.]
MKGKFYCVGIGPGDPELLTIKAVKYITSCPVLAVPQGRVGMTIAKNIVLKAVRSMNEVHLEDKEIVTVDIPMTRDEAVMAAAHANGAAAIEQRLDEGKDVVLIVLGCPTVYASSIYVHRIIVKDGYDTEIVPGVTSFCAAAAKLQQPLCEKDEPVMVIPGNRADRKELLRLPGNAVIMKPSGPLADLKHDLEECHLLHQAAMVERCGLDGEKVYPSMADAEESAYFSVVLVRK